MLELILFLTICVGIEVACFFLLVVLFREEKEPDEEG